MQINRFPTTPTMLESKESTGQKKFVKGKNHSANNPGFARHSRKKAEKKKKRFSSRAVKIASANTANSQNALVLFLSGPVIGRLANRLFLLRLTACRCLFFLRGSFFLFCFLQVATAGFFCCVRGCFGLDDTERLLRCSGVC